MDAGHNWNSELTALIISPAQALIDQFTRALGETRAFQIVAEMKSYPSRQTLEIRLRQLKPDVVLIDVGTDLETAAGLIRFLTESRPPVQAIGIHGSNDSAAVVRALRAGAVEFLYAPFEAAAQREAVARIRRLRQPPAQGAPEIGKVVVFSSAKPGAGASTLATHLAFAIRRATGRRVLLADLDLAGGTQGFYLRIAPGASIMDALEAAGRLEPGAWATMVASVSGVDVLAAPEAPYTGEIEQARLHDLLDFCRVGYDWVLIDTPAVFHRHTLLAVSECDQAFLVTTADLASLHLARKAVSFLLHLGFGKDRYQVIVNRLSRQDGIGRPDIEKIFNCAVHASFPNDYFSLHRVLSLGEPLSGDCELGKAISALAGRLTGTIPPEKKKTESKAALSV
jgi:pilus assembly protein CpaE